MSPWKCYNCGLVNFANVDACRRCQTIAPGRAPANPYGQGNFQMNRPPQPNNQQQNNGYQANPGNQQNHSHPQNGGYGDFNGEADGLHNPSQAYGHFAPTGDSKEAANHGMSAWSHKQHYVPGRGEARRGIWRDGNRLLMHRQTQLPDRCVMCNTPTNGFYITHELSWMPKTTQAIGSVVMLGVIGYNLVKKTTVLKIGICKQHHSKMRTKLIGGRAMVIVGVLLLLGALTFINFPAMTLCIAMIIYGAIIAGTANRIVYVDHMDDDYIWLSQFSKEFLLNFPVSGRS
jgi:hypothetical protein